MNVFYSVKSLIPYYYIFILPLILLFIIYFFYKNIDYFKEIIEDMSKNEKIILILTFILGFLIRFLFPHGPFLVYDEFYHIFYSQNFLKGLYYSYPLGAHFLLFLILNLIPGHVTAFYFSTIVGSLSILFAFFLGKILFNNKAGLFSAILLSFLPYHIKLSSAFNLGTISMFFVLMSLTAFFLYLDKKDKNLLYLTSFLLIYTVQIRPENVILIPLFFIGFVLFEKNWRKELKRPFFVKILVISFFILLPLFIHLGIGLNDSRWIEDDSVFSLGSLSENIIPNSIFWLDGFYFPVSFSIMSVFGLYFIRKKKNYFFFFVVFFFSFFLFLSSFWATNIYSLTQMRYSVLMSIPVLLLSGFGFYVFYDKIIRKKIIFIFVILCIFLINLAFHPYLFLNTSNYYTNWIYSYELVTKSENTIEENCTVVTIYPDVTVMINVVTGLNTISPLFGYDIEEEIRNMLGNRECVIYYENYCCYDEYYDYSCDEIEKEQFNYTWSYICNRMRQKYNLKPILNLEDKFGFYEIVYEK